MTITTPHILIVEDDAVTRALLASYFAAEGYRVSEAETGQGIMALLAADPVDVVLLDIKLPGKDGLTLTRELRARSELGIILVTSKDEAVDRIVGLEIGADAYVTKPFNPRELLAQVKALLRRVRAVPALTVNPRDNAPRDLEAGAAPEALKGFAGWTLDLDTYLLTSPAGEAERLTRDEFQLLAAFVHNGGRVLSRDQLLDKIRNREWTPTDRTVDVLVSRLRRKLKDDPADPQLIVTVHGRGYLFTPKVTTLRSR